MTHEGQRAIETAADYLNEDEIEECREKGIDPSVVTVQVASRNDGPEAMRNYDEVVLTRPNGRVVTLYGYAPKEIKVELLGYW